MEAEQLIASKSILGEGAYFDEKARRVLWLDIFGCEVHELDPWTDMDICHSVSKPVTTIVPADEGFVVGAIDGVFHLSPDFRTFSRMPSPQVDYMRYRCNDGKCGPDGRFWIGLVNDSAPKGTGLLYLTDDRECTLALDGLDCPNGIVWNSRRDQVYYTDSLNGNIYAFDYADSIISNRRVLFHTDQGYPDGMTIDTEDMIWAAVWGSGCVFRIDPHSGRIVNTVETGAPNVTSVAIANRKLYITSAARGMSEAELSEYPQSGSLFVAPVETEGASLFRYVGRHEIYK